GFNDLMSSSVLLNRSLVLYVRLWPTSRIISERMPDPGSSGTPRELFISCKPSLPSFAGRRTFAPRPPPGINHDKNGRFFYCKFARMQVFLYLKLPSRQRKFSLGPSRGRESFLMLQFCGPRGVAGKWGQLRAR